MQSQKETETRGFGIRKAELPKALRGFEVATTLCVSGIAVILAVASVSFIRSENEMRKRARITASAEASIAAKDYGEAKLEIGGLRKRNDFK